MDGFDPWEKKSRQKHMPEINGGFVQDYPSRLSPALALPFRFVSFD